MLRENPSTGPAGPFTLDVTKGGFPSEGLYPVRDDVFLLYSDTADRLQAELSKRFDLPRAVHVCPDTEPFPPQSEIQGEVVRAVEVLAQHGIDAWLNTRGYIRPRALRRLAAHRKHLKVTVKLSTLNRNLQRTLEPMAAPPRLRLRQIARLRELGVAVQVALEPLVPGMTDTRANLAVLLEALAGTGIRQITAGYLFLRPVRRDHLQRALEQSGLAEYLLQAFERGPVMPSGRTPPGRYLPKNQRQRGYAALMALAAEFGITVRISRAANPDFRPLGREAAISTSSLPLFCIRH